jgi:hypothetical protein
MLQYNKTTWCQTAEDHDQKWQGIWFMVFLYHALRSDGWLQCFEGILASNFSEEIKKSLSLSYSESDSVFTNTWKESVASIFRIFALKVEARNTEDLNPIIRGRKILIFNAEDCN